MTDTDALLAIAKPQQWTSDCFAWKPANRGHPTNGGIPDAILYLLVGAVRPWHSCDGSYFYATEEAATTALFFACEKYKQEEVRT